MLFLVQQLHNIRVWGWHLSGPPKNTSSFPHAHKAPEATFVLRFRSGSKEQEGRAGKVGMLAASFTFYQESKSTIADSSYVPLAKTA